MLTDLYQQCEIFCNTGSLVASESSWCEVVFRDTFAKPDIENMCVQNTRGYHASFVAYTENRGKDNATTTCGTPLTWEVAIASSDTLNA